jgi:hypothetical protein
MTCPDEIRAFAEDMKRKAEQLLQLADFMETPYYQDRNYIPLSEIPFQIGDKVIYKDHEGEIIDFSRNGKISININGCIAWSDPKEVRKVPIK